MNVLQRLAIYILRKSNATVLINCNLEKTTRIKSKNNLWVWDNTFPGGTTFVFSNGAEYVVGRATKEEDE